MMDTNKKIIKRTTKDNNKIYCRGTRKKYETQKMHYKFITIFMCKFYSGQIGIIGEVFEFKFQKYFLDISL